MIIVFMGWPGSGATEIADAVRDRINGLHIDKERYTAVFGGISEVEYYHKLGILARTLEETQDKPVIVDSVFNLEQHRKVFGKADIIIWVDTIENKDRVWESPTRVDQKIINTRSKYEDSLPTRAINVIRKFNLFDWKADTTFMVDTYQEWNQNNVRQYKDIIARNEQVVIGVKHVSGMTDKTPLHFEQVNNLIKNDIPTAKVIKMPNIKNIVYTNKSSFTIEKMGESYA